MGSGVYKYQYDDSKSNAEWLLLPGGRVQYSVEGKWKFQLPRETWNRIVAAMDVAPLRNDEIPIVGEIIGWRCWRLFDDAMLWSLHQRQVWLPDEVQQGHVGEDAGGVYAFKTKARAVSEARKDDWEVPIVVGSVKLWGDAIEAENGWRAEFAKIVSLDMVWVAENAQPESPKRRFFLRQADAPRFNPDALLRAVRRKYLDCHGEMVAEVKPPAAPAAGGR